MFKLKHERTADCVVAGYRTHKNDRQAIGSLLLGINGPDGDLRSVGVIGALMATRKGALRGVAGSRHRLRRPSVELGQTRGGRADTAGDRRQSLGCRQGPVVHATAAGASRRGSL